jgi:hypothetical protein
MSPHHLVVSIAAAAFLFGCSNNTTESGEDEPLDPIEGDPPAAATFAQAAQSAGWGANVSISIDGDMLTVVSDGLPDHGVLDAYALFGGGTTVAQAQDFSITIPLNPETSNVATEASLGAIGIAISGAVFFNPYEGDGTTVALDDNFVIDGVPFLDDCNGHPIPTSGQYHYHGVPQCISSVIDSPGEHSKLVGYLLDGHPIYGPQDVDGVEASDLDACLGHYGTTPEFPEGVYHYHTSNSSPYISPCYRGIVDVVMQAGPPGGGPPMP